ncbi:hexosaminidase D-like [Ischnura elegans]|uniref:hexosaminidase D-like n=1 Tax=Ischnura elegans TaxID=197161 RepID=UPI001ED88A7D|nr:hexosaminidase D-like [Ischnura elegans]XP_046406779.1 hexosaminidase D-like [Ischnura elegans]XP_046406780.1 hexosaminidase D-like [Ischnura elegans]
MERTISSNRLVHLDLKGAPAKVSYYEKLFPMLKKMGATGLLVEWEDTFPYGDEVADIGSSGPANHDLYSKEDARLLLELAKQNDLVVIPLVQTFGHLEFVLKHKAFQNLREVENYPSSMCPTNPNSLTLVKAMIKQIVEFHSDLSFLHIGADEVWHMALCERCQAQVVLEKPEDRKSRLFLNHVLAVAKFIQSMYPSLGIIIWDDMLRSISPEILMEYDLGKYVEPMVWHYRSEDNFVLPPDIWAKYSKIFPNFWVASAFKGATGSSRMLPIPAYHIGNHLAWLKVIKEEAGKFENFRGVALTGWSRYDHFATLCEMLPVAIPCLALCLQTWISGTFSLEIHDNISKDLGFSTPLLLNPYPRPQLLTQGKLDFPGWEIMVGVEWFTNLQEKIRSVVDGDQVETWFNEWQIKNSYTNPMQIESLLASFSSILTELASVEVYLRRHMASVFHMSTLNEWLGTWIEPRRKKLVQLEHDAQLQMRIGGRVDGGDFPFSAQDVQMEPQA